MQYPYNDDFMIFDKDVGQYVIRGKPRWERSL